MSNSVNDYEHWADRAEKMRMLAAQTQDETAKRDLLGVAAGYDKLAQRATARSRGCVPESSAQATGAE